MTLKFLCFSSAAQNDHFMFDLSAIHILTSSMFTDNNSKSVHCITFIACWSLTGPAS